MKYFIAFLLILALFAFPLASHASDLDISALNNEELLLLRLNINNELAHRVLALDVEKASGDQLTLRELVPDLILSKHIRDNIGLISIDQVPTSEQLASLTSIFNHTFQRDDNIGTIEGIQFFPNIEYLSLSNTFAVYFKDVKELPDGFYSLSNLTNLDLSATSITSIDKGLGNLTKLKELDLSGLQISDLPDSIGNLIELKKLDLSDTNIASLPDSICNLPKIERIDLSGSSITSLPADIGNLTSLKHLNISHTNISELPLSIYNLQLETFKREGLNIE